MPVTTVPPKGSAASKKLSKPEAGQRKVDYFLRSAKSTEIQSTASESLAPTSQLHRSPLAEVANSANLQSVQISNKIVTTATVISSHAFSSLQSPVFGSEPKTGSVPFGANMDIVDNLNRLSGLELDEILYPRSYAPIGNFTNSVKGNGGPPAAGVPTACGPKLPEVDDTASAAVTTTASAPTIRGSKKEPDSKPPNRASWNEETWIETSTKKSTEPLTQALEFFSQSRTEAEAADYLEQIPEHSGWIHPLIPKFQRHRGKKAVLTILMCPKKDQRMDFDVPPPDVYAFTHSFLLPIGNFVEEATGMPSIAIDFRKECRRKGEHCANITDKEFARLAAATQVELLIARNVFDITFVQTTAWSRDVATTATGLDQLLQLEPNLLGQVDRISFHPRALSLVMIETQLAQNTFWHAMHDFIFPILSRTTGLPVDRVESDLRKAWKQTTSILLRTVVVSGETKASTIASLPDILSTPNDLSKKTVNRPLLSQYALMASSSYADQFVAAGLLPTWFLHQPREIPTTFGTKRVRKSAAPLDEAQDTSSVDGERRAVHPSPDPSTEDTPPRMMPNPIFDVDFIMSSPTVVVHAFYQGLTGAETLDAREQKNIRAKRRKANLTEEQREEVKKRLKVYNAKRKEMVDNDPEMRDRINADRRARRKARKEIANA
ncbi:hypothetical protein CI238_10200 [Colletotrichum incanum]|uniref:Uncharacterized protein n=1 Tax=Colletotrichum incanum TaxID=1573173 RepID=A0A167ABK4_COLIC|nr:hypothetical protein CI238_10200 [Colletotrichum incanum]